MANRRMFSNRIANSAKFLQMPAESQLLYFHMVQRSDDDGVVEAYPLLKLLGLASDNFKLLIAKGYVEQLNEDQVILIMDWSEHNTIRADRKVDSIHKKLLLDRFPEIKLIEAKPRIDVEDNSRRIGGQSTDAIGKVRLGKVRLGYSPAEEKSSLTGSSLPVENVPCDDEGNTLAPKVSRRKLPSLVGLPFELFWNLYPRKEGMKSVIKVWWSLGREKQQKALDDLPKRAKSKQWTDSGGKFVSSPFKYLTDEKWNDEIVEYQDKKPSNFLPAKKNKYEKY